MMEAQDALKLQAANGANALGNRCNVLSDYITVDHDAVG